MAGEMEKPLVIGKAAKPRCFKTIDVEKLPVSWYSNKKAWMTGNNAVCHSKLDLSNIKLAWFPPNTTSITQPMDQGIIYCVKLYYRRLLMQSLIANVDKISVLSELSTEYRIATEKTRQKTLYEFWNL
ncbi:tigger transposable element-derived protein 6-like [Sipha flava]|uniref:Tigger transposable element-derived protein 6-like n=1 Tax=Sipha flava TaxID=143950 RepID=A0A8B8FFA2_9HEMI|nr:tigger transposable element-derived protein 6-like [Sipha flava]